MQYDIATGVQHRELKFKKLLIAAVAAIGMVAVAAIPALAAGGPTTGPEAGPGCFGNWRAGTADGSVFAERKGTNSTINADNRATCEALSQT